MRVKVLRMRVLFGSSLPRCDINGEVYRFIDRAGQDLQGLKG